MLRLRGSPSVTPCITPVTCPFVSKQPSSNSGGVSWTGKDGNKSLGVWKDGGVRAEYLS